MYLIIDNHSRNVPFIENFLKREGKKYKIIDRSASHKEVFNKKVKGIILSGGKTLSEKVLLKDVRADIAALIKGEVPILGICAGHQLMAITHGGIVAHLKEPSLKKNQLIHLKKNELFKGLPEKIHIYEHHFRYVKDVEHAFKIIASSSKDKIEGIKHKTKPFYGLQSHPEKNEEFGNIILKNFVDICEDS